jgi:hypothetical protein
LWAKAGVSAKSSPVNRAHFGQKKVFEIPSPGAPFRLSNVNGGWPNLAIFFEFRKPSMRAVQNEQMTIGEVDVSKMRFNYKSRDDIPFF